MTAWVLTYAWTAVDKKMTSADVIPVVCFQRKGFYLFFIF